MTTTRTAGAPAGRYVRGRQIRRVWLWFAVRRLAGLRDEAEMHRSLGISFAEQAQQLERRVVLARLELQS